uniref:Uncharacterized protein n=1 Tax=Timema shepardi TaxID=629360 RepID=A0A7R9G4H0_TIMSH|nr:unnamed protein product [Timema shepardi]
MLVPILVDRWCHERCVLVAVALVCVSAPAKGGESHASSYAYFKGPVEGPAKQVVLHDGHISQRDLLGHEGGHEDEHLTIDYIAQPKYEFGYGVSDAHHGDSKTHKESHDGHRVVGEYSVQEPSGNVRTVKYISDKNGFQADVHNSGANLHSAAYSAHEALAEHGAYELAHPSYGGSEQVAIASAAEPVELTTTSSLANYATEVGQSTVGVLGGSLLREGRCRMLDRRGLQYVVIGCVVRVCSRVDDPTAGGVGKIVNWYNGIEWEKPPNFVDSLKSSGSTPQLYYLSKFCCFDFSVKKYTPGILSGEKQRIDRGYDFTGVLEWFAERVDRIVLLFDAHKLDISDEFRRSIEALRGHDDKIRIILNKADMVDHQQLMRVYGALMWSLGKILNTPEVARVYIGSYWDQPLRFDGNRRLFEDEEQDLFADLKSLPRNAALRKLTDLSKRARLAKAHAYIIGTLANEMPSLFGKEAKKQKLISELDLIFEQVQLKYQVSPGDFPDIRKMKMQLAIYDFSRFRTVNQRLLDVVDEMLATDIANLMALIPQEEASTMDKRIIEGGAFSVVSDKSTPFGYKRGEGIDAGAGDPEWVVAKKLTQYNEIFQALKPVKGKIMRTAAKTEMVKSKLPNTVLGKIYLLADVDEDGLLDAEEFALVMHLINVKLEGHDLPAELPSHLIPPSKRDLVAKEAV